MVFDPSRKETREGPQGREELTREEGRGRRMLLEGFKEMSLEQTDH